jgi:hypothetical protein
MGGCVNRCLAGRGWTALRIVLVLAAVLLLNAASFAQSEFRTGDRIVALGDLHGGFDDAVSMLRSVGLIDGKNKWKGGKAHLVQTGDVLDRGADSRKILDLLMDLQQQAAAAGGMVHALLGNHESMNIMGDLRYADRGEFDAFKTGNSKAVRDQAYQQLADPAKKDDRKYRSTWEDQHPLGWVEHRDAFGSDGKYGKWLRQNNTVIKINDLLFAHGGISPKYASWSLQQINDRMREELRDFSKLNGGIVTDSLGPLWYRGLAEAPASEISSHVNTLLSNFGVEHIVIAHTPTSGIVLPRFGGKVVMIDVGLSRLYGQGRACLLVEGNKLYAFHRGVKLALPLTEDVTAFMQYLRAAENLEPTESLLHRFVSNTARALGRQ